jgi:hypothetical protein
MFRFSRRPRTIVQLQTRYVERSLQEQSAVSVKDAVERLRAEYASLAVEIEPDLGMDYPWTPYKLGAMNGLVKAAAVLSGQDQIVVGFQFDRYASLRVKIAAELAEHTLTASHA